MENPQIARELDRDVAGCASAHQRLLAGLEQLTDLQARQPSLLPDWTVGHVVTHLARNADSLTGILRAADEGRVAPQYPSLQARNDDIEAGAGRPADELVGDLRASIWRLEGTWATTSAVGWAGHGLTIGGQMPITELPFRRWAEVEIHHADLGLGYLPTQWPDEFVRVQLRRMTMLWASRRPMGMSELPAAALQLDERTRLLWLLGRADVAGLPAAGIF